VKLHLAIVKPMCSLDTTCRNANVVKARFVLSFRAELLDILTHACAAEDGFEASMLEALVIHLTCTSCVIPRGS